MRPCVFVLVCSLGAAAHADEVYLKSGGRLTGEVVSEDARLVVVEVGPGKVTIPAANVLRVESSRSALGDYRERAARLETGDVQGWLQLAFWAHERDLGTQAQEAFEHVLRIDPGNASANGALGRVQLDGAWMSLEESFKRRGYVYYDGEWMTAAEQEARLRARAADELAASARREGELRVREAEARAREAEAEAQQAEADAQAAMTEGGIPLWWGWGGWGSWGWSGFRPPFVRPPHKHPPTTLHPPNPPKPPVHPRPKRWTEPRSTMPAKGVAGKPEGRVR
jgi:hypothetical protein